jgi:hypothetical protein
MNSAANVGTLNFIVPVSPPPPNPWGVARRLLAGPVAVGEALVGNDAVGSVLVVLAVAVVVAALGHDPILPALALQGIGLDHHPRVVRVGDHVGLGIGDPHPGDPAVAVFVIGPVLADQAVEVAVQHPAGFARANDGVARPASLRRPEHPVVRVRVQHRRDVERVCGQ